MWRVVVLLAASACSSSSGSKQADAAMAADAPTAIDAPGDAPASTLPASDDFAGAALDPSWTVLEANRVTVAVTGGALRLTPAPNALWYNASRGGLVYKMVTGDFIATATVHARKTSNAAMPPSLPIELGGVMARAPGTASENYVFIVIGYGEQNGLAVEHKSTTNSASTFAEIPFGPDAELRLCRKGAVFTLYRRTPGAATWTQDYQVTRTDLPAALQVGPNAYDMQATPDVTMSFDQFTFAPVVGGNCES